MTVEYNSGVDQDSVTNIGRTTNIHYRRIMATCCLTKASLVMKMRGNIDKNISGSEYGVCAGVIKFTDNFQRNAFS